MKSRKKRKRRLKSSTSADNSPQFENLDVASAKTNIPIRYMSFMTVTSSVEEEIRYEPVGLSHLIRYRYWKWLVIYLFTIRDGLVRVTCQSSHFGNVSGANIGWVNLVAGIFATNMD